ncbi:MAG TPA: EAL domain-containing protein [Solirubrobacteraceae bacterium]|nr:EAL domain-containing protein [Solirubrobacteraceae bacterium]
MLAAVEHLPPAAAIVFDRELRVVDAGGALLASRGWNTAAMAGRVVTELLPEPYFERLAVNYDAALRGESSESHLPSLDRTAVLTSRFDPITDAGGSVIGGMVVSVERPPTLPREADAGAGVLTVRERRVLALAAEGRTTAEIAEELVLAPSTIESHIRRVCERLDARNRAHAVTLAIASGQLDLDALDLGDVRRASPADGPESAGPPPQALRRLAWDAPISLYVKDTDYRYTYVNRVVAAEWGFPDGGLVGMRDEDFLPAETFERIRAHDRRVLEGGETLEREEVVHDGDGRERVFLSVKFPVRDAAGTVQGLAGVSIDVTAHRRHARNLARVIETATDAILTKTLDGTVTSWNRGAERLYGYTADEAVGSSIRRIVPADHDDVDDILRRIARGDAIPQYETVRVHRDGTRLAVSLSASPIRDDRGRISGAGVIARDVTERRRLEARLRHLADHDPLTGLFNRRRFEEELERQLRYAERYSAAGAVLVVDIDHFKYVNDTYGHHIGDELLRGVTAALGETARDSDILARLGGDEFAVLAPHADADDAAAFAARLLAVVEGTGDGLRSVSASVGIAAFTPDQKLTASDVLVAADIALHEAKEAGRGRSAVYTGERRTSLPWVRRLRAALEEDGFVLFAQPIVDLRTGDVVREELLLRLPGEDGQVIAPGAFLPTAERFGMMLDIDRWVVAKGLELAAEGRSVSINLSGQAIGDESIGRLVEDAMTRNGGPAGALLFEITESLAITNMERARRFAERLRALGCGLALDDFGTGFGSFTYLRHLPANYLKLDMAFVRGLRVAEADRRVVGSIVGIADAFGIETIAEGVEDEETLELLRYAGVDLAQGYHLGRPAPIAALSSG